MQTSSIDVEKSLCNAPRIKSMAKRLQSIVVKISTLTNKVVPEINCKEVMQENRNNFKILLAHISKQTLIKSKKRLSHQQQPIRFNF